MAAGTPPTELRELPEDELVTRLREAKEELFNLRFQVATGQLDNNKRLQTVRRDIARIYTIMRERELGLSVAPSERAGRGDRGRSWPPEGARGLRRQRQDGQDGGGPRRGPGEAPALRQGAASDQQAEGA